MKCPVCNYEINGFVCSECGFDESMNYEKFPTLAVCNNNIESISAKIVLHGAPWEIDGISDIYKHELLSVSAWNGIGKAQKELAEFCFDNNEIQRFEYWKQKAESNGYKVNRSDGFLATKAFKDAVYAGEYNTVRLFSNGTCVSTKIKDIENNSFMQDQISDWTDIVDVAVGKYHTLGLKKDGTVVAAGKNNSGQCNVSDWTDIVAVAATHNSSIGFKKDGTVVCCGDTYMAETIAKKFTNLTGISSGSTHIVGVKQNGTVVDTWFMLQFNECDVSQWKDVVSASGEDQATFGLKSDGTVVSTRNEADMLKNTSFEYRLWRDIVSISSGENHTVGLKKDGTVVACGENQFGQCEVSLWRDIVYVSAGFNHTVGLKSNGVVVVAGDNRYGQCNINRMNYINEAIRRSES